MTDKTLDCSDLDRHMGKPIDPGRLKEPLANNDIRRWVQAMHYPNRVHYEDEFAAQSRFGRIVAPQSFAVATDDGHGTAPACVGLIPNSHLIFGGDEWWFHGPRIYGGDLIHNERVPLDYVVKDTKFAGPTCFQRGDNRYYNAQGDLIATQRSTSIRYRADLAREMGSLDATEDPEWTDQQLLQLEEEKFSWIRMLHELGHGKRYWDEVNVGDKLPTRVIGPHSIASFTTEYRAFLFSIWGTMYWYAPPGIKDPWINQDPGWVEGFGFDEELALIDPRARDGLYLGPSRGHIDDSKASEVGMSRAYGYGATMAAWNTDYLAFWAGHDGMVRHAKSDFRGPAFESDVTFIDGEVVDKIENSRWGFPVVQVNVRMSNQAGTTVVTSLNEVELPY